MNKKYTHFQVLSAHGKTKMTEEHPQFSFECVDDLMVSPRVVEIEEVAQLVEHAARNRKVACSMPY